MKSSVIKNVLERYGSVEKILNSAKDARWPYPKTFGLLETIGVKSYVVKFIDGYDANYFGIDGRVLYKENPPEGYHNLRAAEQFSADKVKDAIKRHMVDKTSFFSFLEDIANAGVSNYVVDMDTRTVSYNDTQDQFHVENVPEWDWDLE